jgi:drug/metabolite transporter (DMT)-like permease
MTKTAQAAAWMGGWLTATLAMTVAGRELATTLPVVVLMFFRAVFATAVLSAIVFGLRGGRPARTARLPLHIVRNILHYGAQYCWFWALALIPMAQVISIEFTLPIWAAILAVLFLGERLGARRVAAVALGFLGVLVIVRPGLAATEFGQVVALAAALGFAATVTMTKALTRTDEPLTVIFYMFAIQIVIGAVPTILEWQTPQGAQWFWLALVATAGTFSHFCLTKAMSLADNTVILPMDFLRVPLTAVAGLALYGDPITPWLAGGAALILAGNLLNLAPRRRAVDAADP